ncbi:hypothetical protein BT93_A1873 [Corymbia citriodora subsp. variegata]|nr:hypothetical protein BT93_A1873 [Corymbia citriodora subsp. variegata]
MPERRVHIISSTTVKPSSPTPHHRRTLNLSLLDHLFPPSFAPLLLFYTKRGPAKSTEEPLPRRMQASLSETLVDFYPLAGRIRGTACIDCNDEGAYWIEAQADVRLDDFLAQAEEALLNQFLPNFHAETLHLVASGCMLIVQITTFSCGSIAVAPCTSHKLMDGSSIACFLRSWSARSAQMLEGLTPPRFIGDSLTRARELPLTLSDYAPMDRCATRRFVFHDSKISGLKAEAARSGEPIRFTRVELVLALILRCAFKASRSITGSSRPSLLQYMVNLRDRMSPALQEIDVGNFAWAVNISFRGSETTLQELVSNMRKEMIGFLDSEARGFRGDEGFSKVCKWIARLGSMMGEWKEEANVYRCSSLCGFPFYEVDFGSGKPAWATCLSNTKNYIYLMDTKMRDGIEAWVTLGEREMAVFERDEQLLASAALNPSAAHRVTNVTFPSRI